MARIFAMSDLHVDYVENKRFVERLSPTTYQKDVLLVAGDVTHDVSLLKSTLQLLKQKFKEVVFVPGNHDIWIREAGTWETSIGKFHQILKMCKSIDVRTDPVQVTLVDETSVWIVPLFSWYSTPEEDATDSLFVRNPMTPKVDYSNDMWMDFHWCLWPADMTVTPAKYFADLNSERCAKDYGSPIVTLSHMLPRRELVKADADDLKRIAHERRKLGLSSLVDRQGAYKNFDFTRFAGSWNIDKQIRQVGSMLHVYGHQHRNRDRTIEGVRYVSHCLGSVHERRKGLVSGVDHWKGPKQILPAVSDEIVMSE